MAGSDQRSKVTLQNSAEDEFSDEKTTDEEARQRDMDERVLKLSDSQRYSLHRGAEDVSPLSLVTARRTKAGDRFESLSQHVKHSKT